MRGREDERTVGLDAFVVEGLDGAQAVFGDGHLDHDLGVESGQFAAFGYHVGVVGGQHFGADSSAGHQTADLPVVFQDVFVSGDAFLGHQGRVGRYSVEDAHGLSLGDLLEIGRVDKEFHKAEWYFGSVYSAYSVYSRVTRMGQWSESGTSTRRWYSTTFQVPRPRTKI